MYYLLKVKVIMRITVNWFQFLNTTTRFTLITSPQMIQFNTHTQQVSVQHVSKDMYSFFWKMLSKI